MRVLKQSTSYNLMILMVDSTDHVTGETGLTLTITASKDGAAFASISPTVTERGSGFYNVALTSSHTDTLGDLALHITGSGADPADVVVQVRANVLGDTLPANVTQISGDATAADNAEAFFDGTGYAGTNNVIPTVTLVATTTNLTNLPSIPAGWLTAAGIADGAITAAKFGSGAIDATAFAQGAADKVWSTTSRTLSAFAFTPTPGNAADTTAIKAKTDQLTFTTTNKVDAALNAAGDFPQAAADKVWATAARTLTAFGFTVAATVADKTGYKLASDGLDSVSTTAPSGVASNFREMVVQTWRRLFKKSTLTSTQLKTYADDGSTTVTTQTVSDDGTTQTQGPAS